MTQYKTKADWAQNHLDTCTHRPQPIGTHNPCCSSIRARQRTETVIARIQEGPLHYRLSKLPCQKDTTCTSVMVHFCPAKLKSQAGSIRFRIFRSHPTPADRLSCEVDSQAGTNEFSFAKNHFQSESAPICYL